MNITKSEATILQAIAQNELNSMNYGVPTAEIDTATWTSCIDACDLLEGMEMPSGKSISGIVSSLVKKELVWITQEGRDSTIQHSTLGFQVWVDQVFGRKNWEAEISKYSFIQ